jgi:hypothetical protein
MQWYQQYFPGNNDKFCKFLDFSDNSSRLLTFKCNLGKNWWLKQHVSEYKSSNTNSESVFSCGTALGDKIKKLSIEPKLIGVAGENSMGL